LVAARFPAAGKTAPALLQLLPVIEEKQNFMLSHPSQRARRVGHPVLSPVNWQSWWTTETER
jgi:hypothetical protein